MSIKINYFCISVKLPIFKEKIKFYYMGNILN